MADVPEVKVPIASGGLTIDEEIERYHRTGESDPLYSAWSGNFMERANRAHDDLRGALRPRGAHP